MNESQEPSYYEIALTNRQVVAAFVLLLSSVLVSFLSGVWVGRSGASPAAEEGVVVSPPQTEEPALDELEDFKFFSGEEPDGAVEPPPPARQQPPAAPSRERRERSSPPPAAESTLAEEVGNRPVAPPAVPPPSPPAGAANAVGEPTAGFVIQVFSTKDKAQAEKVIERLALGGYRGYLSPVEVGKRTMFRVRLGPYPSHPAAEQAASEIGRRFHYDTWITAADR